MKTAASSGARPLGLSGRFKHAARVMVVAGAAMLAVGIAAQAASASPPREPHLTRHAVTFTIPAKSTSTKEWTLSLWSLGLGRSKLVGRDSGTSGTLRVTVPKVTGCDFQVDVKEVDTWYSGFRRSFEQCGSTSPTSSSTSTTKPKTTGTTGVTPTTASQPTSSATTGPPSTAPTSVPSSKLAFTGVGLGLWILSLLGILFISGGAALLVYSRRYPRLWHV